MGKPATQPYIWENPDWPDYTFDARALATPLAEAEHAIADTLALFRKLPVELEKEAQAEITAENAFSTSRIEGEIFNPDELRASAFRRLDAGPAPTKAKPSAKPDAAVAMVLDATRDAEGKLTLDHLARWQRMICASGDTWRTAESSPEDALRTKKVFVVSHKGYEQIIDYEAPPPARVPVETRRFLTWFNGKSAATLPPLIRAGLAHLHFETLHPFPDGNGRVGRALIDRTLVAAHGPDARAVAIAPGILRERDAYYAALKAHNRTDALDATPWLRWFLRNLAVSAPQSQKILLHVQAKARFWLVHRTTPFNDKQRKAVNRMLDAGPAGFVGGMTNRKYVALTGASDVTAYRDLAALVAYGALRPIGEGRSRAYELNLPKA